jgi:hypothetical protein
MESKCGTRIAIACIVIVIIVIVLLLGIFFLGSRGRTTDHFQMGKYQPLYLGQGRRENRRLQNIFNWGYRGNDTAIFIGNNTQNTPTGCTMNSSSSMDEIDDEQYFYDLVEPFRYNTTTSSSSSSSSSMKRPRRKRMNDSSLSDSFRIPKSYSKCVTPFGVDVTDPSIYRFSRGSPRVEYLEKDPQKDYSLSTFIRGDLSFPNAGYCMVGQSRYGQKSLVKNGLFAPNADLRWYALTSCNSKDYCTKVDGLRNETHVRRICIPRKEAPYDSSSPC